MNIGVLQSLVIGSPSTVKSINDQSSSAKSFGSVFGQIMSATPDSSVDHPIESVDMQQLKDLLQADTLEELKEALLALPGFEPTQLTETLKSLTSSSSVEDLLASLLVEPKLFLDNLNKMFIEAGLREEDLNSQLGKADVWTMIGFLEEAGVKFFDKLSGMMDNQLPKNETVTIVSFLKMLEFIGTKSDMTVSIEQKLSSFTSMFQSTVEQMQIKLQNTPISKQGLLLFMQEKVSVQTVQPKGTSTSDSGSSGKQSENTSHGTVSANTFTTAKAEFSISQEPNASNRSESLMREMQILLKRSNFGQVGGSTRMLIKLYPEHLGQIRIELHESNGVLSARILASTSLAKGMLDSQLHQLRHAFTQQNLQVDRIDISQSIQDPSRNDKEQAFNEQFKQQQEQHNEQQQSKQTDEETSFEEYLIELEV